MVRSAIASAQPKKTAKAAITKKKQTVRKR
jgi:hypothetical protein